MKKFALLLALGLSWTITANASVPDSPGPSNKLAMGLDASCRIQGTALYCWGPNTMGAVGDGTTTARAGSSAYNISGYWKSVHTTYGHTCAINTTDDLYCWGLNDQGQLGQGDTTNRTSPTRVGTNTYYQVTVGHNHTCALLKSGASIDLYGNTDLRCWGDNSLGQFGDATTNDSWTPIGTYVKAVYLAAGDYHTCAIIASSSIQRTIRCTGENSKGQVGNNTYMTSTSWVPPYKSDGIPITMNFVKKLSAGGRTTCVTGGLTTANTELRCWGDNSNGQAGGPFNTTQPYVSPSSKCMPSADYDGHPATVDGGGGWDLCHGFSDVDVGRLDTVAIWHGQWAADGDVYDAGNRMVGMGWGGYDQFAYYGNWLDHRYLHLFDEPDGFCYAGNCNGVAGYTTYLIGVAAGEDRTMGYYDVTWHGVHAFREYGGTPTGGYPSQPWLQLLIDAPGYEY